MACDRDRSLELRWSLQTKIIIDLQSTSVSIGKQLNPIPDSRASTSRSVGPGSKKMRTAQKLPTPASPPRRHPADTKAWTADDPSMMIHSQKKANRFKEFEGLWKKKKDIWMWMERRE
ncbi:unnamed protein product [Caenorhabditis nigoni]